MEEMVVELQVGSYGDAKTHWWPTSLPLSPVNRILSPPSLSTSDTIEQEELSAQSISTYPLFDNGTRRDGDPICDAYSVHLYENGACFALADGCGWGPRSFKAAQNAIKGFNEHVDEEIDSVGTIQDAACFLLSAMSQANEKIWDKTNKPWEVGSTTFLGALLLSLDQNGENVGSEFGGAPYVLVCANIGDCKAFLICNELGDKPEVIDLTVESKRTVRDKCDPGGRIGPYLEGHPDTRNLLLSTAPVYPGDIICIVSDGVHDNLDPETLGLPLSDSIHRNSSIASQVLKLEVDTETQKVIIPPTLTDNKAWESIDTAHAEFFKAEYRESVLADLYADGASTPSKLLQAILDHCVTTTKSSREFMEQSPAQIHPPDFALYPGKMDHTTAIIYRVPNLDNLSTPTMRPKTTHKPHILETSTVSIKFSDLRKSGPPVASTSNKDSSGKQKKRLNENDTQNISPADPGTHRANSTTSATNNVHELDAIPPRQKKPKSPAKHKSEGNDKQGEKLDSEDKQEVKPHPSEYKMEDSSSSNDSSNEKKERSKKEKKPNKSATEHASASKYRVTRTSEDNEPISVESTLTRDSADLISSESS